MGRWIVTYRLVERLDDLYHQAVIFAFAWWGDGLRANAIERAGRPICNLFERMSDQNELDVRSVTEIVNRVILPQITDQIYNSTPLFFNLNRADRFRADIKQNCQWARIGDGILPWIPDLQRQVRALRSRGRFALGSFLLDHGIIEVPDDWEW